MNYSNDEWYVDIYHYYTNHQSLSVILCVMQLLLKDKRNIINITLLQNNHFSKWDVIGLFIL